MLKPAIETAVPQPWAKQDKVRQELAQSLVCYVSDEDMTLSRRAFLATVASRIQDDLNHDTQ